MTPATAAADLAAGVALLSAGLIAWTRARGSRTGLLLVVAGVAWLAGDLSSQLAEVHRGPLVHAVLTFPTGRTRSVPVVIVIVLAYVEGIVPARPLGPWPTAILLVAVVVVAAWRWAKAVGLERRTLGVPLLCTALVATPLLLAAVGSLMGSASYTLASLAYDGAVVVTAVALAADLISGRSARAAATGLVVDLAGQDEPREVRDALARALGDPGLAVAYRVGQDWVDESGESVSLPLPGESPNRVVTLVEDGGVPIAALVHDAVTLRDTALARSVGAAVRLMLANVRLQAEEAARMQEVVDSRRRLVEAGDDQRRLLREQLRAGAGAQLTAVSRDLRAALAGRRGGPPPDLGALIGDIEAARTDLDRFAQGIHPQALTDHGLSAALAALADHAALPVILRAQSRHLPAPQEAAAFFVCSEALTNAAKYADATCVWIDVVEHGSSLVVSVVDDGRGGATLTGGSGLRGLVDRVEAVGGRLSISSPAGAGTRLVARFPIADVAAS
jgi:signal transduction histidine kinase